MNFLLCASWSDRFASMSCPPSLPKRSLLLWLRCRPTLVLRKSGFHLARDCLQALMDSRVGPREEHTGLLLAVQFLGAQALDDTSRLWDVPEVCRPVAARNSSWASHDF